MENQPLIGLTRKATASPNEHGTISNLSRVQLDKASIVAAMSSLRPPLLFMRSRLPDELLSRNAALACAQTLARLGSLPSGASTTTLDVFVFLLLIGGAASYRSPKHLSLA